MPSKPSVESGRALQNSVNPEIDRHKMLNLLSGLLAGLRALEGDLVEGVPKETGVHTIVDEYMPTLIGIVQEMAERLKSKE